MHPFCLSRLMYIDRLSFLLMLFVAVFLAPMRTVVAQEDEELIIIEDESDDELIVIDDDADDELIVITDDEDESSPSLDNDNTFDALIESHLLFRPRLRQDVFAFSNQWNSLGSLTALELTSGWLGDDWGVHLNGLWRWWVPDAAMVSEKFLGEWGAWYEFYVKQSWDDHFHLQLGKQMVPWGLTQVFSVGDRLQPAYRTPGVALLEPVKGSEPLWGLSLRSQLSIFSSELVVMLPWNAERNYLNVSAQGHYQLGRYQEGLNISDARIPGQRYSDYMEESSALEQLALGFRVEGQVDEVTLGGSIVYGPDQTPSLIQNESAYLPLMQSLDPLFAGPDCDTNCENAAHLDLFRRTKVGSIALEGTWSFGLAIIKLEWLHYLSEVPQMGKVMWLWGDKGLKSQQGAMDALVLAAESGLGEWIEGSLELGLFRWGGLSETSSLFGVEAPGGDDGRVADAYYRPVAGARLQGYLWPEWVGWTWAHETGLLTQDSQNKVELALHWPGQSLYFGLFAEVFQGPVGTPGYFRSGRDRAGLMIGGGPW